MMRAPQIAAIILVVVGLANLLVGLWPILSGGSVNLASVVIGTLACGLATVLGTRK